jgi:hypothetical protein
MKAKLVTYSTEGLSPTERSILSKRVNGYLDKSNKAKYTYKRKGIITQLPHIKITNKAFIIRKQDFSVISKEIRKHKATLKSWDIEIKQI